MSEYPREETFEPAKWDPVKQYACAKCGHIETVLAMRGPPRICTACFSLARYTWGVETQKASRDRCTREDLLDTLGDYPEGLNWPSIRDILNADYSDERNRRIHRVLMGVKKEGLVEFVPDGNFSGVYRLKGEQ